MHYITIMFVYSYHAIIYAQVYRVLIDKGMSYIAAVESNPAVHWIWLLCDSFEDHK